MLSQLIYASTAVHPQSEADLIHILKNARDKNLQHAVTGMLIYRDGIFLQVIEGAFEDVDLIWQVIQDDKRHTNILVVLEQEIKARDFPEWSMGFCNASGLSAAKLPGYNGILEGDFSPASLAAQPGVARSLLLAVTIED